MQRSMYFLTKYGRPAQFPSDKWMLVLHEHERCSAKRLTNEHGHSQPGRPGAFHGLHGPRQIPLVLIQKAPGQAAKYSWQSPGAQSPSQEHAAKVSGPEPSKSDSMHRGGAWKGARVVTESRESTGHH